MYCNNCGNKLLDNSNFCHVCGTSFKNKVSTANVPASNIFKNTNKFSFNALHIISIVITFFILIGCILPTFTYSEYGISTRFYNVFEIYKIESHSFAYHSDIKFTFIGAGIFLFLEIILGVAFLIDLFHQKSTKSDIIFPMINCEIFSIFLYILSNIIGLNLSWVGWLLLILPILNIFIWFHAISLKEQHK